MPDVPAVTQRAYLLRLRPADRSQLDALWTTHEAVNRGAQWFGDWLLTLRASLGAEAISSASDAEQRRVLLSLCWFTVEDERGAPPKYIICRARESAAARAHTLCERLRTRLRAFSSLDNETIEQWVAGCRSTFAAHIRDDAVWVDRAQAFEDTGWPRSEAAKIVKQLLGDAAEFLTPLADGDAVDSDDAPASNKARGWLSKHWGSGEKSDRAHIARTLEQMCEAAHRVPWDRPGVDILRDILKHIGHELAPQQRPEDKIAKIVRWRGTAAADRLEIRRLQDLPHATEQDRGRFCETLRRKARSHTGHSSASSMADAIRSQVEEAVGMPFRGERDHIGEYSTMLDHAIRRVMAHFSWIRRADAKRRTFENDAKRMQHVSPEIRKFLEKYIAHRTQASGAGEEGYRLRLAAVAGWEKVHKAWRELKSAEERKLAAREQQALATELDEKFGDIVLFDALAEDAAAPIRDAPAEALLDYVKASIAAYDAQRFKVPAYRHPDPLRHPVFVEFGNSRWEIRFLVQDALRKESSRPRQEVSQNLAQRRTVRLDLWSGINIQRVDIRWQGQRFVDDLALDRLLQSAQATEQSNPEPGPPTIAPRAD
ncbi:MAG: type V CRISPR-associated protein Cas12b, partial [Thermoflexales bacterium]|nr:type V CRISPR-associated protein Cas12b [Thermoflexales bacterium]